MNEMNEALAAIGGEKLDKIVSSAPEKVPAGKTVIAVQLGRNPQTSGRFMTAIQPGEWQPAGMAVALRAGRVEAANYLLGHWTKSGPKVTGCHKLWCPRCKDGAGNPVDILMPLAVWQAKDLAKKEIEATAGLSHEEKKARRAALEKEFGWSLIRKYGQCSCGAKWVEDQDREKKELAAFAQKVLKDIEAMEKPVPAFLPPKAFTVHPAAESVPLEPAWQWVADAMAKTGQACVPFEQNGSGPVMIFNPGYWLGYVDDWEDTDLFFLEKGVDRIGRGRRFNPGAIDGL